MQEKDMVNDLLSSVNASLTDYASIIAQTDNQQLRQELIQIRNKCETSQYSLYQMAAQKGYYKPAQKATPQEIQEVKSSFTPVMQ